MMTTGHPPRTVLANLQILRAVAALSVVLQHLSPILKDVGIAPPTGGVDLFFVLSGYIIGARATAVSAADFMARRALRIIPLYWSMVGLAFASAWAAPGLFNHASPTLTELVKTLLFVPYRDSAGSVFHPVLVVGWTLNYEMFFYAVFAAGRVLTRNAIVPAVLALLAIVALFPLLPQGSVVQEFYGSPILLEFAGGLLLTRIQPSRHAPAMVALLIAAVPAVLFGRSEAAWVAGAAGMAVVFAAVSLEKQGIAWRGAVALGDASYALYLSHVFITAAALTAYQAAGKAYGIPIAIVALAAACMTALAIHREVEGRISHFRLPITRFRTSLSRARIAAPTHPPAK